MERDPHVILGVSRFSPWSDVRAAYRGLARRYHPDGSAPDHRQMAAVNAAYEALERQRRDSGDRQATPVPMGPGVGSSLRTGTPPGPPPGSLLWRINQARMVDSPVLDFGQYAGWRIAEIADHDPRYLVWLSRHSSGLRFRRAIEQVLGSRPDLGRTAAVIG